MRKLEGAALKKTMAELKKGKNGELVKAKGKNSPPKKGGILRKTKKGPRRLGNSGGSGAVEPISVNGKDDSDHQVGSVLPGKDEGNGGVKFMQDETDPYCPDFDDEPALLPLISRKRKPVLNSLDNCLATKLESLPPAENVSMNGDIKENIEGQISMADNNIKAENQLQNGSGDNGISGSSKKSKKNKLKVNQIDSNENGGTPKANKKRKESTDNSAENVEHSPPKKKKKEKLVINCQKCSKTFSSEKLYDRHLKICSLDEEELNRLQPHKCSECDYRSPKKAMVTRHLESHGIFKCVKCNFVGDTKEAFREHTLEAHKDRVDMKLCRICSRYVKCDVITLEQHMSECKGKVPLFCPECKKEFKYESSLNVHLNSHYPDRPKRFSCQQCDYKSNYKANLQKHVACMHENRIRSVKCEQCDKLFYSEEAMKRHAKLHADERPYICSVCGHGCRTLSAYKSHQEIHKPNNSFLCTINDCCDGFRTAQLLKKHEETFHKVSPKRFHCREKGCKLSFFKRSHLRRHETTHTGERKYLCEWEGCGKAFRHADNLKVHMRQHTNENPVKCELCPFTCKQKSSLKWHMGKHHPEEDKKKKALLDCPGDDWAFWEAVMAVIGPDGTALDEAVIGQKPVASKESKSGSKKKGTEKKKKSGQGKKKQSKKSVGSSKSDKGIVKKKKKADKSAVAEKVEDNTEKTDDALVKQEGEDIVEEEKSTPKEKKKKGAKRKSPKTAAKSKDKKASKSKTKTNEASAELNDEENVAVRTPKKRQKKTTAEKCEQENECENQEENTGKSAESSLPAKVKKVSKGKKLSKSKACKVTKRKGKAAVGKRKKVGKKVLRKPAKKSPKVSTKLKDSKVVEDDVSNVISDNEILKAEPVSKKRKRGKADDQGDLVTVKAKKAKKSSVKTRSKKTPTKSKKKASKAGKKKSPTKAEIVAEEEEADPPQEEEEEALPHESEETQKSNNAVEIATEETAKEEQPPEELDSDSDLWGNNDDNNTEEPDRNCDADDERDLDNDDDMDKMSEAGFLGDMDTGGCATLDKHSVDDDARSHASDANNSVSDVASLDDAIPDTPPRAPMRPNDNEEEIDENDYYQPPPSPPRLTTHDSVDQRSVERQDSEQTVIDNSLPHSNNTCTPQDVLSEENVVKDSMTQPDATPTYVHTPQSQQPEAPPPHPNEKDYFGQYLQDLPNVEDQAAPPPSTQNSSPGEVPEDLTNIQIPSGDVEGTSDEIKALDLRPEPVSTITHTRLQRETVTGLANANIERETVSTITHTSRTVQPIVTQPSCIPVPGMQTDVMSYQRMELLACGRPENFMQQKESSLQRLTSITYQNFGNLDSVNPTCRDMNYLRPSENMFPRSCAGGSFMRVTDGDGSVGRAGMNSFLRQSDTSFVRPETSLTRAANPSLLRPGTEDLFARDAMGRPVSRSPFHGAWPGAEIRPAHWNQNPYLQRPVDRTTNSATPALLGTERDFAFDPSRSIPDQNVFSNLSSQQHELSRDTPFPLERFDLSSYFGTHPYSATPALEYGHPTCGANQKAFEDRLRQPSAVPDLRGLPQPPSTDMLNQFCGINVNPSFNLDKYMYARDPVYRPQHVTGTGESAFLSHTAPTQPTYFSRDYTGRTLYPQSNPYALMDDRQYGTASKLTHPASVQQDRDLMGRRSTTNDNQIQDPYRRSVIYNVMNRF